MLTTLAPVGPAATGRTAYLMTLANEFGSPVTRITPDTGTPWPVVGGAAALDSRHHYSKDQPWNHDSTLLKLQQKGGSPGNLIVDAGTYQPVFSDRELSPEGKLLAKAHETRWRPGYPHQMVSVERTKAPKGIDIVIWYVLTGQVLNRMNIPSDDPKFGWIGEGQISDDGRWTVFTTTVPNPHGLTTTLRDYVVVVDLERGRVGPRVDISPQVLANRPYRAKEGAVGNCGISPLGNFVEIKISGRYQYGYCLRVDKDSLKCEPIAGRAGQPREQLSHPDFNLVNGREVIVGGARNLDRWLAGDAKKFGNVVAVDCETGAVTHCSPGDAELGGLRPASMQHGSGRAYGRRGWHLCSFEMGNAGLWGAGEIMWVSLDGSRKVERLGFHRSYETGVYRAEAHPVADPTGKRVLFASNDMGIGGAASARPLTDVKAYVIGSNDSPPPDRIDVPPAELARYYVDAAWAYEPHGAVVDRSTGKMVPLEELARVYELWSKRS